MLLLDTDVLSVLERAGPRAARLADRIAGSQERILTTIVSCEEQLRGWIKTLARAKTVADEVGAYRLCDWQILDFDEVAAVKFQELKKAKIRIGTMDLKIAAIALAHDATLLTGNAKDFKQVPDLKFTDWEQL